MTGALAGPGLADGEQSTQPAVGTTIGWIDQNGGLVGKLDATANNETDAGRLGGFMGPDHPGDTVHVGNGERLQTTDGGLGEKLVASARAAQEREVGGALELSILHRRANVYVLFRYGIRVVLAICKIGRAHTLRAILVFDKVEHHSMIGVIRERVARAPRRERNIRCRRRICASGVQVPGPCRSYVCSADDR